MTVTSQTTKVTATGNGSATTFSFSPLVIFASTDLVVVTTVTATGVETVRTEGTGATNWSTSLTSFPATGSIVYPADTATPLPSTETITIKRVLTLEQQTDLENQGTYFADTQETALDKLLMIDLQQQEAVDRSLKLPVSTDAGVSPELPVPVADAFIKWDSAGTALESSSTTAGQWLGGNGTTLLPYYSFTSDPNIGMWRVGADQLGWSVNGVKGLDLSTTGLTVTGELDAATLDISGNADIDGTTNLDAVDIDGNVQLDGTFSVGVNDTGFDVKFFGATSGRYMLWDESADSLLFSDNAKAIWGQPGNDIQIYHDGSDSYIRDAGAGALKLTTDGGSISFQKGDSEVMATMGIDGAVELRYDNAVKIATTSTGVTITGAADIDGATQIDGTVTVGVDDTGYDVKFFGATSGRYMLWDESADNLLLSDSAKLILGQPGNDLQIYHDGSNSYIRDAGDGALYIDGSANVNIRMGGDGGETAIQCIDDGAVSLYYNNAVKIATAATGVTITGAATATTMTATGLITGGSLTFATGATITAIADEDNMASNSATLGVTQQSLVAYVASVVTGAALWSDVAYKTVSDSPIAVVDANVGTMYAIDASGGAVIVNLAAISALDLGGNWAVGFKKTDTSANTITINRAALTSDTIDGGTSYVLNNVAQGVTLIPDVDGSPNNWTSIASGPVFGNASVYQFTNTGSDSTASTTSNGGYNDGVSTTLTISQSPLSESNVHLLFDGVTQHHDTYTLSGAVITTSSAIPTGTAAVEIIVGETLAIGVPSDATVTSAKLSGNLTTPGNLSVTGTVTTSGIVSIDDTTQSTSTVSGSLHTDGGLGVAKAVFIGNDCTIPSGYDFQWVDSANRINYNGTAIRIFQASVNTLECDGGLVTLPSTSGGLSVDSTVDSTSATTGSLHTDGGLGVAKDVFVGSQLGVQKISGTNPFTVYHDDTSTAGTILIEQDGTGDPSLHFLITGLLDWSVGVDNSDSDNFKIARNADLGSNTALSIDSALTVTFSGDIIAANAAGPTVLNEAATATNPTLVPNRADLDTGVGWGTTNELTLVTAGAERVRVGAAGIVEIVKDQDIDVDIGRTTIGTFASDYAVFSHIDRSSASEYALAQTPAGGTIINTTGGQPLLIRVGNAEKIAMNTSGHLGIGCTDPAAALDVRSGEIRMTDGRNLSWGSANCRIQGAAAGSFEIYTGGAARLVVAADGDVSGTDMIMQFPPTYPVSGTSTTYQNGALTSTDSSLVNSRVPCPLTVKKMYVYVNGTLSSGSAVVTLMKDGVAQSGTIAVDTSGGAFDSSPAISFTVGQRIGIKVDTSSTSAAWYHVTLLCERDAD